MIQDDQRQELAEWFTVEQQIDYTVEQFKDKILEKATEIFGRPDQDVLDEIGTMFREWADDEDFAERERSAKALRYASNLLMSPRIPV